VERLCLRFHKGPGLATVIICVDSTRYRSCSWVVAVKTLQKGALAAACALAAGVGCGGRSLKVGDGGSAGQGGSPACRTIQDETICKTRSDCHPAYCPDCSGAPSFRACLGPNDPNALSCIALTCPAAGADGAAGGTGIGGTSGAAGADGLSPDAGEDSSGVVGAWTLTLEAYGGPSGDVAADVPLDEPGVGPQVTCTGLMQAGACQLTSCQGVGGIGSPVGGHGNFGPISVSVGTTTVSLTYGGFGYGTVYFPPSIALATGGKMTFQGGDGVRVPRFDVSAIIPGLAVLTSPVSTTDGGATSIDTSRDLTVTWVPISIGKIHFGFSAGDTFLGDRVEISVACSFEGASGSGVVPQAILSSLKEMSGTKPTYAALTSGLEATTVVDGLTIVTQSYQSSPTTGREFNVTLQ
jgi:hypothetical protein